MSRTASEIQKFVKFFTEMTAPPGEELHGFDDRILFEDMVKLAQEWKSNDVDYAEPLLEALRQLELNSSAVV